MRWGKRDTTRLAADTNIAFNLLFIHVRNGYNLATSLEANQIQRLTGTNVPIHHIVQMAREIVMIQNGVKT